MRKTTISLLNYFRQSLIYKLRMPELIIIIFFLYLLTPASFFQSLTLGLDGSWMMAVYAAIEKDYIFGSDFVFTYGPLGFLAIRLPSSISSIYYKLFDLYVLFNLGIVLYYIIILRKHNSFIDYCVIFIIIILMGNFYSHNIVMVLLWILLFMIFYYIQRRNKYLLLNIFLLTVLLFFIKVNISLVATFVFCTFLIFCIYNKMIPVRKCLILFNIYILSLFLLSLILHVNLPGYILGSMHLINAYNDAMYAPFKLESVIYIAAIFNIILYVFISIYIYT